MENNKRGSFTGSIGFVLAAAGSAVGLGNLWRFPIVAAKDGGSLFLIVYIILMLTFGFALLTTEIAIGRKTASAPLGAYGKIDKRFGFLGRIAVIVPAIIIPYYCVIGGWVTKYGATYISGGASKIYETGTGNYFTGFITDQWSPIIYFVVFFGITALIVSLGVEKGIEKASKIMMPVLFLLIVGLAVYVLTLSYTDADGSVRTALEGLKIYLIPNFNDINLEKFMTILLDATGQMFYSMSIAMGIMITYGSYSKKETNLVKSVNQISFFDFGVAFLAGMIVIPCVYAFQGVEGLNTAGPGLIFVSLTSVFEHMGFVGNIIGAAFFVLVFFAAITSSVSLLEAVVSSSIDRFGWARKKATIIVSLVLFVVGIIVCLGYNLLYFEFTLPNGSVGQILDIMDYISNNLMLPIVAFITCLMVAWFNKPQIMVDEIEVGMAGNFRRKGIYNVMIKWVCPVLLVVILLQAFNVFK